jgi:hypothetical protein
MDGGHNVACSAFRVAAGVDGAGFNLHDRLEYNKPRRRFRR